jgi:hypothetical protein
MVMARGSNICVPCSQTPRGKLAMPHEKTDGYYPGSGRKGDGLRKSIAREQWKERHGENTPMPKK